MHIKDLRINRVVVANCDEIVKFEKPHSVWHFEYLNGDIIYATGEVSFLLKAETQKRVDTGSTT